MEHAPRETDETPPCMALPQRAAHALGSPTDSRSSPGGRRSWGRGRGRPVCRSSRVRTWGTPFSCLQTYTDTAGIRFILLILAGMAPAAITVPGWARESTGAAKVLVAHHLTCQIFLPRHPAYLQVSVFRNDLPSLSCHIPDDGVSLFRPRD